MAAGNTACTPAALCLSPPTLVRLRLITGRAKALGPRQVAEPQLTELPKMIRFDEFLAIRLAQGQPFFSISDASEHTGGFPGAVKQAVARRRTKHPHQLECPSNGFFLIGNKNSAGCYEPPPPLSWVHAFMEYRKLPYRVSLLSAAILHGAHNLCPSVFFVVVPRQAKYRHGCHGLALVIQGADRFNKIESIKTEGGINELSNCQLNVASIEATLLDCVRYANHMSFGDIRIVVRQLGGRANPGRLRLYAEHYEATTARRLGQLLETYGHAEQADALTAFVSNIDCYIDMDTKTPRAHRYSDSDRGRTVACDSRWRIRLNA